MTEDAGREGEAKQGEHSGNEQRNLPELSGPSAPHHCLGQDAALRCHDAMKTTARGIRAARGPECLH